MKVGIIGAGAVVRRGHLPTYGAIPQVKVAGIADINEGLARKVAEEFRIPKYYSNYKELLKDDSLELIDICTPPQTHKVLIKEAAQCGKHILVEKPLALSLRDALEIQEVVSKNGVKLCTAHQWRYFSAALKVKERLSKGYLSKIVTVHGVGLVPFPTHWTLNTWPYHKGGALYDFGPHLIDMILWLKDFVPIRRVYASGGDFTRGNMDFINYAVINIEFEDGSIATADISWVTGIMLKFTLDIYGTAGNMFLDVRNNVFSETHGFPTPFDDIKYFFKKMWRVGTGVISGNYFKGANLGYKLLISSFIQSINEKGKIPVSVEQAVIVNAILEAARASINQRSPIQLEEFKSEIRKSTR